jgi:ADP-ribosyl-[dinitrogen reductase] hydrolase
MDNEATGILLGIAVADALGVPVEFKSREYLEQHPVKGMTGNGTYNQPFDLPEIF